MIKAFGAWAVAMCAAAGACAACEVEARIAGRNDPLLWPVSGEITSGYGPRFHPLLNEQRFHPGIDIAGPTGDAVVAARSGQVAEAGRRGYYGNYIRLDHGADLHTAYGQLSEIDVAAGDCVRAGDVIGKRGSTGLSSGPHLHFELLEGEMAIDPAPMLTPAKP
ncbi:MAG: M23 family metallopeptidase [Hyphomicrobium sp.]